MVTQKIAEASNTLLLWHWKEYRPKLVLLAGPNRFLKPDKRCLKHLIYPVPNPDFPFLGVHYTRMMNKIIILEDNYK